MNKPSRVEDCKTDAAYHRKYQRALKVLLGQEAGIGLFSYADVTSINFKRDGVAWKLRGKAEINGGKFVCFLDGPDIVIALAALLTKIDENDVTWYKDKWPDS